MPKPSLYPLISYDEIQRPEHYRTGDNITLSRVLRPHRIEIRQVPSDTPVCVITVDDNACVHVTVSPGVDLTRGTL